MQYVQRLIGEVLKRDLSQFPAITLTGPRQSGKSTLLQCLLPDWRYVNLEDLSLLDFALSDPKGFVSTYDNKVIIDEVQRAPQLLSQLQVAIDADRSAGRFALSGSHNLLLLEGIGQSLAGRTIVRTLLPFSFHELQASGQHSMDLHETLFFGGYPPAVESGSLVTAWLDSYVQTYVERDVRLIRNVSDLGSFRRFVKLCAGRVGQLLDLSSLGADAGITHNTAKDWIGVLETGFIAFRLQPYFRNYSKRLIKSSKLYFYDTGVLCRLLDIRSPHELIVHPFRGAIFENWCVLEAIKQLQGAGEFPGIYFWRDKTTEVDLLIQRGSTRMLAVESKAGATAQDEFIRGPMKLKSLMSDIQVDPIVVFGGDQSQSRSGGVFMPWYEWRIC